MTKMTEAELMQLLAAITPPDETARAAAHTHWASLAKPLGGLGALETLLEDAAALTGTAQFDFSRRAVAVLCADNGVVAQGISQTDQSVTRAVAENLAARRTSVCRMAQAAHCDVLPVDLGIAGAPVPGVRDCRIAAGTADFTKGPAMTRAEAVEAIGRGIALTRQLAAEGYGLVATGEMQEQKAAGVQLLATGEMGIGNTTTSSAVAAVLLAQPVQTMTGRGAGLSDAGLARKVDTIRRGIACNVPNPDDVLDVLSKLGGFDIAGLCGMFLGGALAGVPVLMDGFISGVAALCAVRLCPAASKAVFASHCSTEPAARLVLDALGKTPLLTAGLHLGEGTGAVASIPLWDMALAVYDGCYSFAEGGIAPYTPQC
jgi:nicotinate-nucleotide--dimethylbenzimidazole phosphoribosyltransferase